jgi:hypothetical protein
MNSELRRRLSAMAARWNDIEERMKTVELMRGETVIACVNELRYTGRRIVDALLLIAEEKSEGENFQKISDHLLVAESYLNNADHDLTDAVVLFVGIRAKRVLELHGIEKIKKNIPDCDSFLDDLEKARSIVISSRGKRETREARYQELAKIYVPRLIDFESKLASCPELIVENREIKRGLQLVSIVALFGSVAGVFTFFLNVWIWWHAPTHLDLKQIRDAMREIIAENNGTPTSPPASIPSIAAKPEVGEPKK